MNSKVASCIAATALFVLPGLVSAADTATPQSRAAVVADTKRAEAAGTLQLAGEAPQPLGARGANSTIGHNSTSHSRRHHRRHHHHSSMSRETSSLQPAGQAPQPAGQAPQK